MRANIEDCEKGLVAKAPRKLFSGGLGPCCAVAFYSRKKRLGYMIHANIMTDSEWISAFQYGISSMNENPCDLVVVAGGNSLWSYDDDEQREYEFSIRISIIRNLLRIFDLTQLNFFWAPENHMGELILDTQTGLFIWQWEPLPL
jgi:hypothetical protein